MLLDQPLAIHGVNARGALSQSVRPWLVPSVRVPPTAHGDPDLVGVADGGSVRDHEPDLVVLVVDLHLVKSPCSTGSPHLLTANPSVWIELVVGAVGEATDEDVLRAEVLGVGADEDGAADPVFGSRRSPSSSGDHDEVVVAVPDVDGEQVGAVVGVLRVVEAVALGMGRSGGAQGQGSGRQGGGGAGDDAVHCGLLCSLVALWGRAPIEHGEETRPAGKRLQWMPAIRM